MFGKSPFNGDLSKWDVSNVTSMAYMFDSSAFTGSKGDITNWDTSSVTDVSCVFAYTKFNQDVSKWDVSKVKGDDALWAFEGSPLEGKITFMKFK